MLAGLSAVAFSALFFDAGSTARALSPSGAVASGADAGDAKGEETITVKILGINDFHGQLSSKRVGGRMAGGAAVLASYLKRAARGFEGRTIIAHAGDLVGASPPNSALLQDEPTIEFFRALGKGACRQADRFDARCDLVGTLGNHELDEGSDEIVRLLTGGTHPRGPFLTSPWRGAGFPTVCANVLRRSDGKPLFAPYVVKDVQGVPVAFFGAMLRDAANLLRPTVAADLRWIDEAEAVNRHVPELQTRGIHAFVLLLHEGGSQASYDGPTTGHGSAGPLVESLVGRLDADFDLVLSGHTHQFTNAMVPNRAGRPVLVVQAYSAGTAFDDVDLTVGRGSHEVLSKSARIVRTWDDEGPGLSPDPGVTSLVAAADARVAPLVGRVVGSVAAPLTRSRAASGESALGDFIADAQRAALRADFAMTNPGGIREDLPAGPVTWGQLYTTSPFGNTLVLLRLTGKELVEVLNQQWGGTQPPGGRILQISGFGYTWEEGVAEGGGRVSEVHDDLGRPLDPARVYAVAVNDFLAEGGDGFSSLARAKGGVRGPSDLDALVAHLTKASGPIGAPRLGRILKR